MAVLIKWILSVILFITLQGSIFSQNSQPSAQPSGQPTSQPTLEPTGQPSIQPSMQPTGQPSHPTGQPSGQPTMQPSDQPSIQPSVQPTGQPSTQPTGKPTGQPTMQPSGQPSIQPSLQPTGQPSGKPSVQPTGQPSRQPSMQPTDKPSNQPSSKPSRQPSGQPTGHPSVQPTGQPSGKPSRKPTGQPSRQPSRQPTGQPSRKPTGQPSRQPSRQPTGQPSRQPTGQPSRQPSRQPTGQPSRQPTGQPSMQPTNPTGQPSMNPSGQPTSCPSGQPSDQPTRLPTGQPSMEPSGQPSQQPSSRPSMQPSRIPSSQPSAQPSRKPTGQPSRQPSRRPSGQPSRQPTRQPTSQPTRQPSRQPSCQPSMQPTRQPSGQPSGKPSSQPISEPSGQPSSQPSSRPSGQPSQQPSSRPSRQPTGQPSRKPTGQPTRQPSRQPTGQPSRKPTGQPSRQPTRQPTGQPSRQPTRQPTGQPSRKPTGQPTRQPSRQPTGQPSRKPTGQPSRQPTRQPTGQPSRRPSSQPSTQPTSQPSTSFPTLTKETRWSINLNKYVSNMTLPLAEVHGDGLGNFALRPQQIFVQQDVKSKRTNGACSSWSSFLSSSLPVLSVLKPVKFIQLTVDVKGGDARNVTCWGDGTVTSHATKIASALVGGIGIHQPKYPIVIICDLHTWRVDAVPIPGSKATATSVCVDCFNSSANSANGVATAAYSCVVSDYFLSPCSNPCTSNGTYNSSTVGRVLNINYQALSPAPRVQSVTLTAVSRTSLHIAVNTSSSIGPATAHCIASRSHANITAPSEVRYATIDSGRAMSIANGSTYFTVVINNLVPLTNYSVYCTTESLDGVLGELSDMVAAKVDAQTKCCKRIGVELLSKSVRLDGSLSQTYYPALVRITVDHAPMSWIQLDLVSLFTPTVPIITIAKQTIVSYSTNPFSPNSIMLYGNGYGSSTKNYSFFPPYDYPQSTLLDFALPGSLSGVNSLNVSVSGESAHEFTVEYTTRSITVLSPEEYVSAPVPIGSELSADGLLLALKFDVATDMGGMGSATKCANLFQLTDGNYVGWRYSRAPTRVPTTVALSRRPTAFGLPTGQPTSQPSQFPTGQPTSRPSRTKWPSGQPTSKPSQQPSGQPSGAPTLRPTVGLKQLSPLDIVCTWINDKTVTLRTKDISGLMPGESLALKAGMIRAKCPNEASCSRALNRVAGFTLLPPITVPATLPKVEAILNLPFVVSVCDILYIDASRSTGSAGRQWQSFLFNVSDNGFSNSSTALMWAAFLQSRAMDISLPTHIPSAYMSPGSYTITLTLCNFFGSCASTAQLVNVVAAAIPFAKISSSNDIVYIRPSDPLSINAILAPSVCAKANGTLTNLAFSWRMQAFEDPGRVVKSWLPLTNTATQKGRLLIPSYSLSGGSKYRLELLVKNTISLREARDSILVYTAQSVIVPIISGPAARSLGVGDTLMLNASQSYDEAAQSLSRKVGYRGLNFSWACGKCSLAGVRLAATGNPHLVSIIASNGVVGSVLTITLTAWTQSRYAIVDVTITVVPKNLPSALISTKPVLTNGAKVDTRNRFVVDAALSGVVDGAILMWTNDDGTVANLADASTGSLSKRLARNSAAFSLILSANALPQQASLTFSLKCQLPGTSVFQTLTSVTVITNSPPVPGTFLVSPLSGTEMSTIFTLAANRWSDDDLPLTYSFGMMTPSQTAAPLTARSEANVFATTLSAVPNDDDKKGRTYLALSVYDSYAADASTSARVKITEKSKVAALSSFEKLLEDVVLTDTSTLRSVLSIGGSILNRANCTAAPLCSLLNRKACGTTPHTCGECYDYAQYAGESGDANTMCYPISSPRKLASNDGSCKADSDCSYFQRCNSTTSSCYFPPVECPGSCSMNGECKFVNIPTATQIPHCGVSNTTCQAMCLCYYGYYGTACAYNTVQWKIQQRIRSALLNKLGDLIAAEVPGQDTIAAWSALLADLSAHPDELYSNKTETLYSTIKKVISAAQDVQVEPSAIPGVLGAVNSLVQLQPSRVSLTYNGARRQLSSTVPVGDASDVAFAEKTKGIAQMYANYLSVGAAADQNAATAIAPSFKIYAKKLSVSALLDAETVLDGPVSVLEKLLGKSGFQVLLPSLAASRTELTSLPESTVTVTMIVIASTIYRNSALGSDAVTVTVTGVPCPPSGCAYSVSVPSRELVDCDNPQYYGRGPGTFSLNCKYGSTKSASFKCPNGDVVSARCDKTEGTIGLQCPHYFSNSYCNTLVSNSTLNNETTCKRVKQSLSSTLCSCSSTNSNTASAYAEFFAEPLPSGRALESVQLTTFTTSIVSTVIQTKYPLKRTFTPVVVAFSMAPDWVLVYCVASIGGLFLVFGFVSYSWSKQLARKRKESKTSPFGDPSAANRSQESPDRRKLSTWRWSVLAVDRALPRVLQEGKLITRLWREVQDNHRWLRVFLSGQQDHTGTVRIPISVHARVMALGVHVLVPLFVLILMYNFIDSDDGSCEAIRLPDQCSAAVSMLSVGLAPYASRCVWEINGKDDICVARQVTDWLTLLQIAIYAAIASAPLASAIDYVCMRIIGIRPIVQRAVQVAPLSAAVHSPSRPLEQSTATTGSTSPRSWTSSLARIVPQNTSMSSLPSQSPDSSRNPRARTRRRTLSGADLLERSNSEICQVLALTVDQHAKASISSVIRQEAFLDKWMIYIEDGDLRFTHPSAAEACFPSLLRQTAARVAAEDEQLANRFGTKRAKNSRLIYLLVWDFLSSATNRRALDVADFRDSNCPVSGTEREAGWAFLALVTSGLGFTLYWILKPGGNHLSPGRQISVLLSLALLLAIEVVLSSNAVLFICHYLLPSLVAKDLSVAKQAAMECLDRFQDQSIRSPPEGLFSPRPSEHAFNAAATFFISHTLARKYPQLSISPVVLNYSTDLPPAFVQHNMSYHSTRMSSWRLRLTSVIGATLCSLPRSMFHLPVVVQDMIFNTVAHAISGYIVLAFVELFSVSPYLVLVPVGGLAFLTHFIVVSGKVTIKKRVVAMSVAQTQSDVVISQRSPSNRVSSVSEYDRQSDDQTARSPERERQFADEEAEYYANKRTRETLRAKRNELVADRARRQLVSLSSKKDSRSPESQFYPSKAPLPPQVMESSDDEGASPSGAPTRPESSDEEDDAVKIDIRSSGKRFHYTSHEKMHVLNNFDVLRNSSRPSPSSELQRIKRNRRRVNRRSRADSSQSSSDDREDEDEKEEAIRRIQRMRARRLKEREVAQSFRVPVLRRLHRSDED